MSEFDGRGPRARTTRGAGVPAHRRLFSPPLTVHDVARLTGQDPQTVRSLARTGELRGFTTGRGGTTSAWRFRLVSVEEFILRREARTRARRLE